VITLEHQFQRYITYWPRK